MDLSTHRVRIDEKYEGIRSSILRMGSLSGEMIRLAVDAIIAGDLALAQHVISMDDEVDDLEEKTIYEIVVAVAMDAPVANDVRMLTSSLGVVGEIEKVADDAVKLARRATKLVGHFPGEMKRALEGIGTSVRQVFASSLKLYVDYDPELALGIIREEGLVDTAYRDARDELFKLIQANPAETVHLVRAIEAFHALEHVADHAVAIASRMRMHYENPNASSL